MSAHHYIACDLGAESGRVRLESESDDQLRGQLARFCADRTLTKGPITTTEPAEAIFLLLTDRLNKTKGQIISGDGGLPEAFLR